MIQSIDPGVRFNKVKWWDKSLAVNALVPFSTIEPSACNIHYHFCISDADSIWKCRLSTLLSEETIAHVKQILIESIVFCACQRICNKEESLQWYHMSIMAHEVTGILSVCSTFFSYYQQNKHQSATLPALCQGIHSDLCHDDVIKWKHFSRYWPFVRGIHRSPVNSPHKGQWNGALMFSLICV